MAGLLSARAFFRDPHAYLRGRDERVVHLAAGPKRFALLREPDAIWQTLVTDAGSYRHGKWKRRARRYVGDALNTLEGDDHRRRRLLIQPSLDRRRVATFAPAIRRRVEEAQAGWRDGDRLVLRPELDRLSLAVAGDVLLGADLGAEAVPLARSLAEVMNAVPLLVPPVAGSRKRALEDVRRSIAAHIERRRTAGGNGDVIGALLAADVAEDEVAGDVTALLLAAVDEPPSALVAAWYLLALNPEAEARLHAELDAEPETRPYLDAVLRETLRLFPPARYVDRCPVHDVEVGGERIRAGTNVLASPLVTHREPSLYAEPERFVPERWLEPAERPRGAYLPFGAGAHACIGEPLAQAIMTGTLAGVARRWRLRIDADAPLPVPRAPQLVFTLERR